MPQSSNAIRCAYTDQTINALLGKAQERGGSFRRHYNQVEEFFLRFDAEFSVPQLPIHHDVRQSVPDKNYIGLLAGVLEQLIDLAPQAFAGLSYLFDPSEVLRPGFFSLYRIGDSQYLYLLRLDLLHRPQVQQVISRGSNDFTAAYSSSLLFLEASFIPLAEVRTVSGRIEAFFVDQTISNTWVDETGRGYFVQGIWIDNDLTKFFSKLFLPEGTRAYPFYPFICKHKTMCENVIDLAPEMRELILPYLHRGLAYLRPLLPEIEESLKKGSFSEGNNTFRRLKSSVPPSLTDIWRSVHLEVYLNDQDMKEYRVDHAAG